MSFASIGETANFVGVDIPVTTGVGFPLNVDLTQPFRENGSLWNGQFGTVQVSRSCNGPSMSAHTPAVALVAGVADCARRVLGGGSLLPQFLLRLLHLTVICAKRGGRRCGFPLPTYPGKRTVTSLRTSTRPAFLEPTTRMGLGLSV